MTLMDEINALRGDLEALQKKRAAKAETGEPEAPAEGEANDAAGIEALMHAVNETIDDFGHEIEKYPRIASATALAVGLALGYFLGRQVR